MRKSIFSIILGTNGTGKTMFLRTIVNKSKRRVIIITPDYAEWTDIPEITSAELRNFTGTKRIVYDFNLPELYANIHDAVVIFDDFRAFGIPKNEYTVLRQFAVRRRQKMLDLFIVAHGFTEVVPYFLYSFVNRFVLFRTHDNPRRASAALNNVEHVLQMQQKVNDQAKKNPHYYLIFKNI